MRRTLLVVSVLALIGVAGPAAHGGEAVPDLLPVEVTVDPAEPIQGDDVTITVTAEVPDIPECAEVGVAAIDIQFEELGAVTGSVVEPVGGAVDAVLVIDAAFPGSYGVIAFCGTTPPPFDGLPNPFTVTAHPDFVLAVTPVTAVAGAAGTISVTGGGCFGGSASAALLASDESFQIGDPATAVADDGSWTMELMWAADQPAGNYRVEAICADLPSRPLRLANYEPVEFTLEPLAHDDGPAPRPPPAPPVDEPPTFTG